MAIHTCNVYVDHLRKGNFMNGFRIGALLGALVLASRRQWRRSWRVGAITGC